MVLRDISSPRYCKTQVTWIYFILLNQIKHEVGVTIPVFKVTSFASMSKMEQSMWLGSNISNEETIVT